MVRRTAQVPRGPRPVAVAAAGLALMAAFVGTGAQAAAPPTGGLAPATPRAAGTSTTVTSSVLDVVSSTGHKLRLRVLALHSDTTNQIQIQVQTRDGVEEHDWTFSTPRSAISVSASGKGRIRMTSQRTAGRATLSLRTSPHGRASLSTCHRKTATRTRHVSLSGTLLLRTRSQGKHAWGNVGSAHRKLHFSTKSKVTRTLPAASHCSSPEFPCRDTLIWQAGGGPTDELDFFTSANRGAHAEIAGVRFVTLTEPADATRADLVTLPQHSPNQLVVSPVDGSATMQATFRGGTVTMASPQPAITQVERCGKGKKKVSLESWSGDLTNGATPIVVPAQIFGSFSTADVTSSSFGRIRVKH